ncbi:BluF protein [Roseivivax halodurans JCM 10272]|uniref:BluF protein n=1 Tax=Roseivivax halodurans JCM 10272 TaxID=1449350 RepID=X7EEP4_9RHOB|nr:histidine phosphatase family protein [Roseivivax halodurans]ETX13691.1 BluF protein [Roseivivax halodurans JCM 10272]
MRPVPGDLLLIRHAQADHGDRLCGRTDVPAILPPAQELAGLSGWLSDCEMVASPAARCVATAHALRANGDIATDARLWEQDFGDFDGVPFEGLPALGEMSREAIAAHPWPGGESFADMAARVSPALKRFIEAAARPPLAIVAHAGTVRAGLGLALGAPAHGLAFDIPPLSVTRLRCTAGGIAILGVALPPSAFA